MKIEELSEKEVLQWGLDKMFNGLNFRSALDEMIKERTHLGTHPFGLNMKSPKDGWRTKELEIRYLGHPGITDISVNSMIAHIRWFIAGMAIAYARPTYLRIILAEANKNDSSKHDVYFEVGKDSSIFICGGCTDFSGEGGQGKTDLEAVFTLLSTVYDVEIERVVIPYSQAKKMQQRLRDAVDKQRS
ncbi:hypothetical protein KKB71_01380 [Patescibacteria group bacterium]|nr:hypothetical protein [Patescibacteria group bacterium]